MSIFRNMSLTPGRNVLLWNANPYTPVLLIAAVISLAVACYSVRQHRTPGAWAIAATMVAAGVWSAGYAMEIGAVPFAEKVFWAKMEYLGICAIPYSLLVFGVRYGGRHLGRSTWLALAVVPVVTVLLVFTNGYHGLIWTSLDLSSDGLFLSISHGPAFWLYWVYSYLLIVSGLLLILNVLFHSRRLYIKQGAIILLGLITPWLGNSLYVLDLLPGDGNFDPTPVCFTFTGILIALGLFRYQLLDIVPVARNGIVEDMRDGIIVLDGKGRILDLNPASVPLLDVEFSEAVGKLAEEVVAGWSALTDEYWTRKEVRIGRPERDYELTITPLQGPRSGPTVKSASRRKVEALGFTRPEAGAVIIFRDITDRKRSEQKLRESEERYRRLVELSPDAIIVHSKGSIVYINRAGMRILTGSEPSDLVGRKLADFVHPEYRESAIERGKAIYAGEKTAPTELKFVREDGKVIDIETASMPITHGGHPAAQMVFREITERKNLEKQLAYQAFHDTLTDLPNRNLFMEHLVKTLEQEEEGPPTTIGILYLDLDGFKLVNDSLGHEYGDSLLVAVAGRLKASVRPGDLVARMGGDEFTVLLDGVSEVRDAELVAERIIHALKAPFDIRSHEVFITTSIGIVVGRVGEYRSSDMLRDADAAMYEAKRERDTRYRVFESHIVDPARKNFQLKNDLRQALNREEFVVYYQPKVRVRTGALAGLEALVRWQHPKEGLLLPKQFMDVAESIGYMPEIGSLVIREVLRQISIWDSTIPGGFDVSVGINLSVRQLSRPEVADEILALIRGSRVSTSSLEFEITEDAFLEPESPAIAVLSRLSRAGIRLSVDDFGTGYSSLSRLKLIPANTIKIDKSLIGEMDSEEATIVAGIIDLSHALGKSVVAEGVENEAQLVRLEELGCDFVQGNYFQPALPAEEIPNLLRSGNPA